MKSGRNKALTSFAVSLALLLASGSVLAQKRPSKTVDPYAVNDGHIPRKAEYDGPLWRFNHEYPKTLPKTDTPWTKVLNGKPLNTDNAKAYILALKQAVSNDMRVMVTRPKEWNATPHNWYSMLWAGEAIKKSGWEGREAIYGTYTGQIQAASVYAESGLKVDIRNYATIYYNDVAAYTLGRVWQKCRQKQGTCPPILADNAAQFSEGSLVVKSAGVNASGEQWPVMQGAAKWQIYRPPFDLKGTVPGKPVVSDIYVGIFDIIVKDSVAAPETGWVFTTLVYDKDAPGADAWDKMVPLGAMWGNDPKVNSAQYPEQPLAETYINPEAPDYAKVTLGYGGRLSGPFDIAVKANVDVGGRIIGKLPSSSCLSCHGTSSFHPGSYKPLTFFYPAKTVERGKPWVMYTPGSAEWNEWFQNRAGNVAQSHEAGAVALDYSTFLEGALMNYAAVESDNHPKRLKAVKGDFWETWRNWQKARKH